MARIYIARTTGIGSFERHVVLKMILPERASDKHSVDMFLDEARLAAALNHQNVAQVFEVGQENGAHYLAMEYVHGQDLRAVLSKAGQVGARIPIELSLAIVAGAAAGLHHAHDRKSPDGVPLGIVHRDVSPSNIMIGYDGAVKLLDFGIAKATARSHETQSGIIKGKFAYMSPEQCRGREVDRRSDVFSLGIILYEITTQHRCFRADSDFDTMHRIVTGDIVRPSRLVATYPLELEKIVMTALAVDSSRRYASAAALLEELESFAAQSRLSPSTMALGRFMRELFGEVPEPWLTEARLGSSGGPPRENTVSNTLGAHARYSSSSANDEPSHQISLSDAASDLLDDEGDSVNQALRNANLPSDTWPPKEGSRSGHTWAGKPSSRARGTGGPNVTPSGMSAARPQAASTLLDMPRSGAEAEDAIDWDAKEYPQAQPTFASQLEVSVERKPSLHSHAGDHAAIMTTLPGPGSAGSASATGTGPSPLAQGLNSPLSGHSGSSGNTGMSAPFGASPSGTGGMTPLSNTLPGTGSSSRASGSNTLRTTGPRRAFGTTQSQPMQSAPPSGGARSATSQPLSMPSLTPLSSDGKTSTASALAALPLGTASFSMESSAEKKRAESLASDLRPKRRVLVVVMVVVLVAAFAALLIIALGGGDVDDIAPQSPQTNAGSTDPASGSANAGAADNGSSGSAAGGADTQSGAVAGDASGSAAGSEAGSGSAGGATENGSGSAAGSNDVPVVPTTGGSGDIQPVEGGDRTVPSPVTMHLQVTSDPKGAEVFLGGKRLGVTPLSVFLPKRSGSATLTVRRARFVEGSAKIDLSSPEVTKSFSLRRAAERREREDGGKDPACQRPESANPFDDTPICGHE